MQADLKNTELILVVFRLNHEEFAFPIASVIEILRPQKLTRMPRAPHFVKGVMNLRGRVFPVVDLKRRLGLAEGAQDSKTRIMVVDFNGDPMGLIMDEVREVFRGERRNLEEAPDLAQGVTRDYLSGVVTQGERMILLLDLQRLFAVDEVGASRTAAPSGDASSPRGAP
jgi:purine-binding chemotaxis protein CheW